MNSRILKKLCKRSEKHPTAFKYLEKVDSGCNDPVESRKFDRKHKVKWCRPKSSRCNYVRFFKNTACYGATSGYYEPEWEDSPAYFILVQLYMDEFTTWDENGAEYQGRKNITPSMVFSHFGI